MHYYEVTCDGELIGHYEASDAESAKCAAMDDTDIPAWQLKAEEI